MNLFSSKYRTFIILAIFFIASLVLRLVALGVVPGGFHEDEAHIGYNAYSIFKTLHDKNNVFLPLAVDQFGDFRPSGLHFLTIPSIVIFGLTEFGTRFPVALFGALSIFVFYLLAKEIFKNETIGLIAAGLMVVNPWHFIGSRSTSESIVAMFFVMLGVYALLAFLRKAKDKTHGSKKYYFLLLSIISFCVSFEFYHAARYFVPFMTLFILLGAFVDKVIVKKNKTILGIGMAVVFGFLFFLFTFGSGSGRVAEVSIFTNPATAISFWYQKSEDRGYSPIFVQYFHNKITAYSYTALTNYGAHFSPDFLFFSGGLPPRYMVPWNGNFYIIDALFILVGFSLLFSLLWQKRFGSLLLAVPFVWLAIGPLPAAFTFEDIPHFQRAMMMMPALLLFAAYGLYSLFTFSKAKPYRILFVVIIGGILLYQISLFMHDYFHHTLTHNAKYRNEGQKALVLSLNEYKKQGRNIVMTTEGANRVIFYLFYNKIDPATYQKMGSPRDTKTLTFDGATYRADDCPSYTAQKEIMLGRFDTVYVDVGECLPRSETKLIKEIYRPDGTVAFKILELSSVAKPQQ